MLLCENELSNVKRKCVGVNLKEGHRCSGKRWNNSFHCNTFQKCFSHPSQERDGLEPDMVENVFNIEDRLRDLLTTQMK